MRGLYAIIDHPHPAGLSPVDQLRAVIDGAGAELCACQLRAKTINTAERVELLERLKPLARAANLLLICNDDVGAAIAAGVDGVHLGQGDLQTHDIAQLRAAAVGLLIGLSTHSPGELRAAVARRPDYVAFGPISATRSKPDHEPVVGFQGLADACRIASLPVVAIGGLDVDGAARATAVGAAMIAVIGGLVAGDVEETTAAAQAYARAIAEARRPLTLAAVHEKIPVLSPESLTTIAMWADDLGVVAQLRLPARFRPEVRGGEVRYRPQDICDLLHGLGKADHESWDEWRSRGEISDDTIVRLRRS